jgi:transcriptional regulator with XRE-family HTH domain
MRFKQTYFDARLYSAAAVCRMIGVHAKELRIARSLRQSDLAKAVGVTVPTISRFEQTGKVGFEVVAGIAIALGQEAELARLFAVPTIRTIDEIISAPRARRRARKPR